MIFVIVLLLLQVQCFDADGCIFAILMTSLDKYMLLLALQQSIINLTHEDISY